MSDHSAPNPASPPPPPPWPAPGAPRAQSVPEGKRAYRAWSRALAKQSDPALITGESEAICANLVPILRDLGAALERPTLMAYVPIRGEIDPIQLLVWAFSAQWRVCVGYAPARDRPLQPVELPQRMVADGRWQSEASLPDAWGIAAPRDRVPLPLGSITAILVPGLAFDDRGHRLGRGAGVYDRFLATLDPTIVRIGLTPELRLVPALPAESHDIPMHLIATERRVLRVEPPATTAQK